MRLPARSPNRLPVLWGALCLLLAATALASARPLLAQDTGPNDTMAGDMLGTGETADLSQSGLRSRPELPEGTPPEIAEVAASGAPVSGLAQALRLAYWTSPTLLSQRALLKSVDYRVPQARAAYGPTLNYQADYSYQRTQFDQVLGADVINRGWSSTAQAILTQPLFTFGRNAAQENVALAQLSFQRQVLRSAEQQALLDAIAAYVGVLRDRASVSIAMDNLKTLESELSDNRARLAVREVTSTDVQQVETRVELGRVQVFVAQRDAATSEATFLRIVGVPAGELAAPNPLQLPVGSLEDAYVYAAAHSPIVLAAQSREQVSRASLAATKAALLPRIEFQGTAAYGTRTPYSDTLRQTDFRGRFVISGPLFQSGLLQARIGEAAAANDSDWRLLDASVRENRANLASSWNNWQTQQASIERFASAVDSARKAYDGALLQERAGLRTTLDVLDLARELLLARSNYNNAIATAYIAQAQVMAAAGALEQSWLLPDDDRYDPLRHFRKVRHRGDIPLLTPLLRVLDGMPVPESGSPRAIRDPAAERTTPPVKLLEIKPEPVKTP
jgi:outer membrane protein